MAIGANNGGIAGPMESSVSTLRKFSEFKTVEQLKDSIREVGAFIHCLEESIPTTRIALIDFVAHLFWYRYCRMLPTSLRRGALSLTRTRWLPRPLAFASLHKVPQILWARNKKDQARRHDGPQFLRLSSHHLLDSQHPHDILVRCRSQTGPRVGRKPLLIEH